MMRKSSTFWSFLGTPLRALHHQLEKQLAVCCGAMVIRPHFWRISDQTCQEKTHNVRTCCIVSSAWSHKGQAARCGNRLLARRSTVQHQLLMASQTKNLHHAMEPRCCKFSSSKNDCSKEIGIVGWFASIGARQWGPPLVLIRDLLLQVQLFHQIPNWRYSVRTWTVRAILMALTHLQAVKTWDQVCCLIALLGIRLLKFGANTDSFSL